jgi:hypothetical protein
MAELSLNFSHSRMQLVLSYRNEGDAVWKELLALRPIEALELARQLEQGASAVRLEPLKGLVPKVLETKTGREI